MANKNQNSVGKTSIHTLQGSLSSKCTTDFQRGDSSSISTLLNIYSINLLSITITFLWSNSYIWYLIVSPYLIQSLFIYFLFLGRLSIQHWNLSLIWLCSCLLVTENAATVIQANFRGLRARRQFRKKMSTIRFLQATVKTWLSMKHIEALDIASDSQSASVIPHRNGLLHYELKAALKIQLAWRSYNDKVSSSILIQSYVRGWITRRMYWKYKFSSLLIQVSFFRSSDDLLMYWPLFISQLCNRLLGTIGFHHPASSSSLSLLFTVFDISSLCLISLSLLIFSYVKPKLESVSLTASALLTLCIYLQRYCRGWLARRTFYFQRGATVCIQSAIRKFNCMMSLHRYKHAATEVQRLVRGQIVRSRLQGA